MFYMGFVHVGFPDPKNALNRKEAFGIVAISLER